MGNYKRAGDMQIAGQKNEYDYYSTPPYAVEALLRTVDFKGGILDPCCGRGEISLMLKAVGHRVTEIDIEAKAHGHGCAADFLSYAKPHDNIVANPLFNLALEFAEKALALARRKVCLITRLAFLETEPPPRQALRAPAPEPGAAVPAAHRLSARRQALRGRLRVLLGGLGRRGPVGAHQVPVVRRQGPGWAPRGLKSQNIKLKSSIKSSSYKKDSGG